MSWTLIRVLWRVMLRVMQKIFEPQGTVACRAGGPSDVNVGVGALDVDVDAVGLINKGWGCAHVQCHHRWVCQCDEGAWRAAFAG